MNKKERIDILLVDKGFFQTREKAKRAIMAGLVLVNNEKIYKPGEKVDPNKEITIKGNSIPYVGRGGFKLEKALKEFNINLNDLIMADIGASTGGFTDCALQHDISLVYAIDVGYNQLDWKLRTNKKVICIERTNFRYATIDLFNKGLPQFASIDVSFISLKLILPVLHDFLTDDASVVALIKPQFEAGKELVGKKGIVRNKKVHINVIEEIIKFALKSNYTILNLTYSPIKGSGGNIEFLVHLKKSSNPILSETINVEEIVNQAHELK